MSCLYNHSGIKKTMSLVTICKDCFICPQAGERMVLCSILFIGKSRNNKPRHYDKFVKSFKNSCSLSLSHSLSFFLSLTLILSLSLSVSHSLYIYIYNFFLFIFFFSHTLTLSLSLSLSLSLLLFFSIISCILMYIYLYTNTYNISPHLSIHPSLIGSAFFSPSLDSRPVFLDNGHRLHKTQSE